MLKRIAKNEKEAFEEFCIVYGKLIKTKAYDIVKKDFLAEEVINEVLFKVWLAAQTVSNIKNPPGWVFTITTNCAKDKIKGEKPYCEFVDMPCDDINLYNMVDEDAFYNHISGLNETERDVLICKTIQGMTFNSIGKLKNMSPSSIASIYYRAFKKIKIQLEIKN